MVLVATQVKRRRGTNDENDAFAGAEGEITVDLTNKELRVHDGSGKTGGFRIGHYSYSSNCMTEIPQDIKLELNNGTLTLKAGSKVYIPNGVGVFNTMNISTNKTFTYTTNGKYLIAVTPFGDIARCSYPAVSGSSQPTPSGNMLWYDTTNNLVKRWDGTQWQNRSFPIAIITVSDGAISSIDQVFNGLGYVGSTVFVLPNVKFLVPEGRNADGSLKNTLTTVQQVITKTIPSNTGWHYCTFNRAGTNFDFATELYVGTSLPTNAKDYSRFYNVDTNKMYLVVSGTTIEIQTFTLNARIEHKTSSGFQISSMKQAEVFHAIDYSDTEFIAQQAMPSDKWVDLTIGASGTTYTAPADGYFTYMDNSSGVGLACLANWNNGLVNGINAPASTWIRRVFLPAKKGDVVELLYENGGTSQIFRFVYANGSK